MLFTDFACFVGASKHTVPQSHAESSAAIYIKFSNHGHGFPILAVCECAARVVARRMSEAGGARGFGNALECCRKVMHSLGGLGRYLRLRLRS